MKFQMKLLSFLFFKEIFLMLKHSKKKSGGFLSRVCCMPASLTLLTSVYFFTVKLFCTSLSQLSTYTIKRLHLFTDFCKNATDPTSCFHCFVT